MTASAAPPYRRRLRAIEIHDFRGIDELHLDFTGPDGGALDLAVIAAENGCGKTSVLEAILTLLGRTELLGRQLGEGDVRFGKSQFHLAGELYLPSLGPGENEVIALRGSAPPFPIVDGGGFLGDPLLNGWSVAPQVEVEYYSSLRLPLITTELTNAAATAAQLIAGPLRPEIMRLADLRYRLISAFYRSLRDNKRTSGALQHASGPFERLQAWWRRFNPATELDVIPMSNDPGSGDQVIVRDADRTIPADVTSLTMARAQAPIRSDIPSMVSMDRLSSGQLSILAFAGPIVFRDHAPDLVLIDEPEQHLHVRWQREVLTALRALSPGTQFIVATHSDEILDAALSYERHILVGDDDPRAGMVEGAEATDDVE